MYFNEEKNKPKGTKFEGGKLARKIHKSVEQLKRHDPDVQVAKEPTKYLLVSNSSVLCGVTLEELENIFLPLDPLCEFIVYPNKRSYSFVQCSSVESSVKIRNELNGLVHPSLLTSHQPFIISFVENLPAAKKCENFRPNDLEILDDYISEELESQLVDYLTKHQNLESLKHRAVVHFGHVFDYSTNSANEWKEAEKIPEIIEKIVDRLLDDGFITERPDQITANIYEPGHGIPSHYDTHSAFNDPIVSLSLLSDVVMEFKDGANSARLAPILLKKRSLCLIKGESRYRWKHGIVNRKYDVNPLTNRVIPRQTRVSLTLRKIRRKPCECNWKEFCDWNRKGEMSVPNDENLAKKLENNYVSDVYENIATHFDETRHSSWKAVKKFIDDIPRGSILYDIGCGNGKYLIPKDGLIKIGCDMCQGLCEIAAKKECNVFRCDALCLPFLDNSSDAVISIAVLHHIATFERRRKMIEEIIRVVKPGGKFCVTVWSMDQSESEYAKMRGNKDEIENVKEKEDRLKVHDGKDFEQQDVLVPWIIDQKGETFLRYYHVFREGEAEILINSIDSCKLLSVEKEQGNYIVIAWNFRIKQMDLLFGGSSGSSDEEDGEAREIRKKEELERRKREIEIYEEEKKREENEQAAKKRRIALVNFSTALEWENVTIGNEEILAKYNNSIPIINQHFMGENNEFEEILRKIDGFEDLKKNEEFLEIHNILNQFEFKILRALTRTTNIGTLKQEEYDENSGIFEKYWMKAHDIMLKQKEDKFRKIHELFEKDELEKQIERRQVVDETRKQFEENFNKVDDIDCLIDEIAEFTLNDSNPIRETSPPPLNRLLSSKSMEKLLEASQHMHMDRRSYLDSSRISKNRENSEELASSSDSDDDILEILKKELRAPRIVKPIAQPNIEFNLENVKEEPMDICTQKEDIMRKKHVHFVDFSSPLNKMRLFCHPLDWYTNDGDDGVTLAHADYTLKDGWNYLKTHMEFPYQKIRHPLFRLKYKEKRTIKFSRILEDLSLVENYEGRLGSRIWYTRENSNEFVLRYGLQEDYTAKELALCVSDLLSDVAHAFRKCFWRDVFPRRMRHTRSNDCVPTGIKRRLQLENDESPDKHHDLVERFQGDGDLCGKISTCLILSDWRLLTVLHLVFTNTNLKLFPSQLGNVFFHTMMEFLKEIFSHDWIEVKTLVFAFGGHPNFELKTICEFLVFVAKLTAGRNVEIHWISNSWIDEDTKNTVDDDFSEEHNELREINILNSEVQKFVGEMKERGFENVNFIDVSQKISDISRKVKEKDEEDIYALVRAIDFLYIQTLMEKCNVTTNSKYHFERDREYTKEYAEDKLRPLINGSMF
ncbi:unnamed protein product [Caenorhabditis angaria]|uniref:Fe2OG dioxygenase domain-containing protein n=1 Tax=Caenorhabditis angaria TaxID=860376 RepID=A0A9P1IGU0_9PELO|nr:unnamed protein product [Caenorhabditis angaria]